MDADGSGRVISLGKHQISVALQLPVRDLRMLDPQLSTTFPAALLVRENAIVVNLEGIRAVITVDHVLLFSHSGPKVTAFVSNLQLKLSQRRRRAQGGGTRRTTRGTRTLPRRSRSCCAPRAGRATATWTCPR